jgi:polyferredoxin
MCHQCERVCPVKIDIKEGLQRQCIACAACIDACKEVTSRRGIKEFISYRARLLRPKAFILAGVTLLFGIVMVLSVVLSPPITVVVKRDTNQPSPLVNSYTYTITNNRAEQIEVTLSVEGPYSFIGQKHLIIGPSEVLTGHFMLRPESKTTDSPVVIIETKDYRVRQKVGYL